MTLMCSVNMYIWLSDNIVSTANTQLFGSDTISDANPYNNAKEMLASKLGL